MRANSLLHFLKCVLSRPVPPCAPVVLCFMVNLHFEQVSIRYVKKVGIWGISFCSGNSVAGLVGLGVSSSSSFISTSSSNSSSKLVKRRFNVS
ncbi:hypothetical protein H5410_046447 [Solanum commersonii]|uniref:Secreted protein n=1 Tax=Solanum commersonii TaxID=4109 RepID=A0A9J5XEC8_SOLCO|nr:hypothetical protein H5410_046447 [Solanum commersonii]